MQVPGADEVDMHWLNNLKALRDLVLLLTRLCYDQAWSPSSCSHTIPRDHASEFIQNRLLLLTGQPEIKLVATAPTASLVAPSSNTQAVVSSTQKGPLAKLLLALLWSQCRVGEEHTVVPLVDSAAERSSSLPCEAVQARQSSSLQQNSHYNM